MSEREKFLSPNPSCIFTGNVLKTNRTILRAELNSHFLAKELIGFFLYLLQLLSTFRKDENNEVYRMLSCGSFMINGFPFFYDCRILLRHIKHRGGGSLRLPLDIVLVI